MSTSNFTLILRATQKFLGQSKCIIRSKFIVRSKFIAAQQTVHDEYRFPNQWCAQAHLVQSGTWRGVARGAQFPGRQITMGCRITAGAQASPANVKSTFFNTLNLLPKEFRFEHGDAKLTSWSRRHLTSLCPWVQWFIESVVTHWLLHGLSWLFRSV